MVNLFCLALLAFLMLLSTVSNADTVPYAMSLGQAQTACVGSAATATCAPGTSAQLTCDATSGTSEAGIIQKVLKCVENNFPYTVISTQFFGSFPYSTNKCPVGIDNGTSCDLPACPSGQGRDETGACVTDCDAPYRDLTGQGTTGTGSLPQSSCIAGCSYPIKSGSKNCKAGICTYHGNLGLPSGACDGSSPPETTPKTDDDLTPVEQCTKNGQGHVEVNGVVTCVGAGTAGGGDVTVTNPTGGTGGTPSNPTFGEDGGVDTDGDGETDQSKSEYCETHAKEPQCNGDFYGSCEKGFTCDGDAAVCAMAKQQYRQACEYEKTTLYTIEGKAMLDGTSVTDDLNPSKLANREVLNVQNLVQEGNNIGGGQFTDLHVELAGGGVTLPFSKLNFIMQILGGFVLAAAYLNAARIVGVR